MTTATIAAYLAARDELDAADAEFDALPGQDVDAETFDNALMRLTNARRAEAEALAALRQAIQPQLALT